MFSLPPQFRLTRVPHASFALASLAACPMSFRRDISPILFKLLSLPLFRGAVVTAITLCFRVGVVGFDRILCGGIIAQTQRTLLGGSPYLLSGGSSRLAAFAPPSYPRLFVGETARTWWVLPYTSYRGLHPIATDRIL